MYKNYIFDLYGTLIDIETNEYDMEAWTKMATTLSFHDVTYSPDQLKEAYFACCELQMRNGKTKHKYPDIDVVEIFEMIFKNKGKTATKTLATHLAQELRAFTTLRLKLRDGAMKFLSELKRKKKNVYLLSNAQKCYALPEMRKLGILKYFDGIVISSEYQCTKPGKEIFDVLFDKYIKDDKRSCVMIGNELTSDIAGATAYHIDGMYLDVNNTGEKGTKCKYRVDDGSLEMARKMLLK